MSPLSAILRVTNGCKLNRRDMINGVDKTSFPAYDTVMNVLLESGKNLVPPEYFSSMFSSLML